MLDGKWDGVWDWVWDGKWDGVLVDVLVDVSVNVLVNVLVDVLDRQTFVILLLDRGQDNRRALSNNYLLYPRARNKKHGLRKS